MGSLGHIKTPQAPKIVEEQIVIQKPTFVEQNKIYPVEKPVFVVKNAKSVVIERPIFKTVERIYQIEVPKPELAEAQAQIQALTVKLQELNDIIVNTPQIKTEIVEVHRTDMGLVFFVIGLFLVNCIFLGGVLASGIF